MTSTPQPSAGSYTSASVEAMTDREHVRRKPGMYIGGRDVAALHHCINELLDNVTDEALNGHCSEAWITVEKDQTVIVRDNGRGMPLGDKTYEPFPGQKVTMPTPQLLVTVLKTGGKMGNAGDEGSKGYSTSGGTHGVGVKAATYMSREMVLDIWRDGQHYHQAFYDGGLDAKTKPPVIKPYKGKDTGTQFSFAFDPTVFDEDAHVDTDRLYNKLRDTTYVVPQLTFHFEDKRTGMNETLRSERGLAELVERLAGESDLVWAKPVTVSLATRLKAGDDVNWTKSDVDFNFDLALLPTRDTAPGGITMGYTNAIPQPDGGDHVSGLKTGLARAVKRHMTNNKLTKAADTLESEDILQGLSMAIHVHMADPMFASQHKTKLAVSEVATLVARMTDEWIADWLGTHPKEAERWAKEIEGNRIARLEFVKSRKAIRERNKQTINSLLTKLTREGSGCPPEKAEVFLVEGDSAGGSAVQGRDPATQAIFPLRGKPKNAWKIKKPSEFLSNNELAGIASLLGQEYRSPWDEDKLKYHKVIITADADADGGHITMLLLALFYREFRPLIEGGYLYVAHPPLYRISPIHGKDKLAKYAYDERERDKILGGKPGNFIVTRFKGLGEMNPPDLKFAAMDPMTRVIERVTLGEAQQTHELLAGLMGDDANFRREYLRHTDRLSAGDLSQMVD